MQGTRDIIPQSIIIDWVKLVSKLWIRYEGYRRKSPGFCLWGVIWFRTKFKRSSYDMIPQQKALSANPRKPAWRAWLWAGEVVESRDFSWQRGSWTGTRHEEGLSVTYKTVSTQEMSAGWRGWSSGQSVLWRVGEALETHHAVLRDLMKCKESWSD